MHRLFLFALLPAALVAGPLLLQQPTLSKTQIAFVYAGDLWTVPREGGQALRLTSGPGNKTRPMFSPDGSTIAFTGEYDGNVDVYTVPATGGVPKRLTWHPSPDLVLGWSRDGKRVLFASGREESQGLPQLFTIGVDGVFPEKLPLPWGFEASYSPDGSRIAYVPIRRAFTAWKNYRGGDTTPIWLANLSDSKIEKIRRDNSNDINPMWVGEKVYFLSDRNGPFALYSYDTRTKQVKEEVKNSGLDFKSAGAGPDGIVIEQFGALLFFDPKSGKTNPIPVTVAGDLSQLRDHMLTVGNKLMNAHLSPNAARAVFEANGEIMTVPAEKGDVRNITNTTGVMERFPAWSPDGKTIAYLSDESGEYALHLAPQNGEGPVTKIAMPEPGFYRELRWSPDSTKIAFVDSHMRIWYIDIASKKAVQVDKERFWNPAGDDYAPAWSPDSKWLAYSKRIANYMGAIFVYSLATGTATQITDGLSDAGFPVFDKSGHYLFFAASTNSGPTLEPDVGAYTRPVARNVYFAVLSKDQPSPLAPESDEEKPADASKPDQPQEKTDEKPARPAAEKIADVRIDFDNISQRILALPVPPRRYTGLQAGKAGVLFIEESPAPALGQPGGLTVHRYDLKSRKEDNAATGVMFFEVSQNGEKMLTRQGQNWAIRNLPPPPPANGAAPVPPPAPATPAAGQLRTADIEVKVSPVAQWNQMYREAWRVERDFSMTPVITV
jgi:tricorn protease